jgi:hypothetical protein
MLEKNNSKRSAFDQDQPVRADVCRSRDTLLRAAMVPESRAAWKLLIYPLWILVDPLPDIKGAISNVRSAVSAQDRFAPLSNG